MLTLFLPPRHWVRRKVVSNRTPGLNLCFWTEERSGRLNDIDMFVEMKWQRPLCGSGEGVAVVVLVLGVGCLEKLLGLLDWHDDRDPVVGRRVANLADSVLDEPFVDQVFAFV